MEGPLNQMEYEGDMEILILPVKNYIFYYRGVKYESEIKNFKINTEKWTIRAEGVDQFGEYELIGSLGKSSREVKLSKIYETHEIEIITTFKEKRLEGFWKNNGDLAYNPNNTVEIEFLLTEFQVEFECEKGRKHKKIIYVNFLKDDNNTDYSGLSYFTQNGLEFVEGNVYDTTHVVYLLLPSTIEKKYLTGTFDFDQMKFELKQTELL